MSWLQSLWGGITPWTTQYEANEAKRRYKGDWSSLTPYQQNKIASQYGDWAIFGGTKGNADMFYQSDAEASQAKADELLKIPGSPFDNYLNQRLGVGGFYYNPKATQKYSEFLD